MGPDRPRINAGGPGAVLSETSETMGESVPLYLGAGARDGDRLASLVGALRALAARGVHPRRTSGIYETEPVGLPGDRPLYHAAVECVTGESPDRVMAICLEVERTLGRRRATGAARPDPGPRPIDLDLLLWGDRILRTDRIVLPHPRLHLRRFVLEPLAEIAPGARHPVIGVTIGALRDRCTDRARVRRLDIAWPSGLIAPDVMPE